MGVRMLLMVCLFKGSYSSDIRPMGYGEPFPPLRSPKCFRISSSLGSRSVVPSMASRRKPYHVSRGASCSKIFMAWLFNSRKTLGSKCFLAIETAGFVISEHEIMPPLIWWKTDRVLCCTNFLDCQVGIIRDYGKEVCDFAQRRWEKFCYFW